MRNLDPSLSRPFKIGAAYARGIPVGQRPDNITAADVLEAKQEALAAGRLRLPKRSEGVYLIVNRVTGKVYAGRSVCMASRIGIHFSLLRNGRHLNTALQADSDAHGLESFGCSVLTYAKQSWAYLAELKVLELLCDMPSYNIQNVDYLGRASLGPEHLARLTPDTLARRATEQA